MGGRGGNEENVGGRGRRKRMLAGSVVASTNRTENRRRMATSERLERRGPGYIGDHTNLASAAVGRRWVAAVLNKLVQELLPVSSLKERLSSVSPDSASLDVKRLQASAAHFKFSDQLGGQTRDRPQTRQMQQTQHYDQHQSNACPGKMHRTVWCGGRGCAVQTATAQRWSQESANRHSALQSGRSKHYYQTMNSLNSSGLRAQRKDEGKVSNKKQVKK